MISAIFKTPSRLSAATLVAVAVTFALGACVAEPPVDPLLAGTGTAQGVATNTDQVVGGEPGAGGISYVEGGTDSTQSGTTNETAGSSSGSSVLDGDTDGDAGGDGTVDNNDNKNDGGTDVAKSDDEVIPPTAIDGINLTDVYPTCSEADLADAAVQALKNAAANKDLTFVVDCQLVEQRDRTAPSSNARRVTHAMLPADLRQIAWSESALQNVVVRAIYLPLTEGDQPTSARYVVEGLQPATDESQRISAEAQVSFEIVPSPETPAPEPIVRTTVMIDMVLVKTAPARWPTYTPSAVALDLIPRASAVAYDDALATCDAASARLTSIDELQIVKNTVHHDLEWTWTLLEAQRDPLDTRLFSFRIAGTQDLRLAPSILVLDYHYGSSPDVPFYVRSAATVPLGMSATISTAGNGDVVTFADASAMAAARNLVLQLPMTSYRIPGVEAFEGSRLTPYAPPVTDTFGLFVQAAPNTDWPLGVAVKYQGGGVSQISPLTLRDYGLFDRRQAMGNAYCARDVGIINGPYGNVDSDTAPITRTLRPFVSSMQYRFDWWGAKDTFSAIANPTVIRMRSRNSGGPVVPTCDEGAPDHIETIPISFWSGGIWGGVSLSMSYCSIGQTGPEYIFLCGEVAGVQGRQIFGNSTQKRFGLTAIEQQHCDGNAHPMAFTSRAFSGKILGKSGGSDGVTVIGAVATAMNFPTDATVRLGIDCEHGMQLNSEVEWTTSTNYYGDKIVSVNLQVPTASVMSGRFLAGIAAGALDAYVINGNVEALPLSFCSGNTKFAGTELTRDGGELMPYDSSIGAENAISGFTDKSGEKFMRITLATDLVATLKTMEAWGLSHDSENGCGEGGSKSYVEALPPESDCAEGTCTAMDVPCAKAAEERGWNGSDEAKLSMCGDLDGSTQPFATIMLSAALIDAACNGSGGGK